MDCDRRNSMASGKSNPANWTRHCSLVWEIQAPKTIRSSRARAYKPNKNNYRPNKQDFPQTRGRAAGKSQLAGEGHRIAWSLTDFNRPGLTLSSTRTHRNQTFHFI